MQDIVFLVADNDMEQTVRGLMSRPHDLGIRPVTFDVYRHPQRDAGCWNVAHDFLRPFHRQYQYAMVLFDHHGSGQDNRKIEKLQTDLEERLHKNGWPERARVIVFQPELEIWVWSASSVVDRVLGWAARSPDLRSWLRGKKLLKPGALKPDDPKEAMIRALREVQKRPSSAYFKQLADQMAFDRCEDVGFGRFRETLQRWFPPSS
jgi:hypothetical protein